VYITIRMHIKSRSNNTDSDEHEKHKNPKVRLSRQKIKIYFLSNIEQTPISLINKYCLLTRCELKQC